MEIPECLLMPGSFVSPSADFDSWEIASNVVWCAVSHSWKLASVLGPLEKQLHQQGQDNFLLSKSPFTVSSSSKKNI